MTVLRVNRRDRNFLIVDKTCLSELDLSWGAKGLHAYLMGLPHDWSVHVGDLIKRSSNGRDSTRALIKELKTKGYISTEWVRSEATGKYNRLEYVIHELPHQALSETPSPYAKNPVNPGCNAPRPGKPSAVNSPVVSPRPGNPSPGYPAPENPTLISIEVTKDLNNKEKAAAKKKEKGGEGSTSPAAAFSSLSTAKTSNPLKTPSITARTEDTMIAEALTPAQKQRVKQMVLRCAEAEPSLNHQQILREVTHCILSADCFKACGSDFAHKLNAIRVVIQRGEWQAPSGMILKAKQVRDTALTSLEKRLQAAHADANHFGRLCRTATGHTKATFEKCMKEARDRILEAEEKLQAFTKEAHPC